MTGTALLYRTGTLSIPEKNRRVFVNLCFAAELLETDKHIASYIAMAGTLLAGGIKPFYEGIKEDYFAISSPHQSL